MTPTRDIMMMNVGILEGHPHGRRSGSFPDGHMLRYRHEGRRTLALEASVDAILGTTRIGRAPVTGDALQISGQKS
jgi:hypothetical protein